MTANILIRKKQIFDECIDVETSSVERGNARDCHRRKDELHVLFLFPNQSSKYEFLTLVEIFVFVQTHTNSKQFSLLDEASELKGIRFRDLRQFGNKLKQNEIPSLILRRLVSLLIFPPFKAIIMTTCLIFIVPEGADEVLFILQSHIQDWIDKSESDDNTSTSNKDFCDMIRSATFETCAYESIILASLASYKKQFELLRTEWVVLVSNFKGFSIIPQSYQEDLKNIKGKIALHKEQVNAIKEWLDSLLQDDVRMSLMALGYFARDISGYRSPLSVVVLRQHEEIEESISPYLLDFYILESDYELLRETVNDSEDSVLLRLDVMRNQLLLANTLITIVAVNLALGSFVSGIFGMNLDNTRSIEPMKNSFIIVTIVTIVSMFIFTAISIIILIRNGIFPMFTIC